MTLSIGIRNKNECLVFTDCLATKINPEGKQTGFTEALKLTKICDGIFFSMVGDENGCKEIRNICRALVYEKENIDAKFIEIEQLLNQGDFSRSNCEFLILSRHKKENSSLYYYSSSDKGLIEIHDGQFYILGSGKDVVGEKLKKAIPSAIAIYAFKDQFPRLISNYLNQWCFGSSVHEGFIGNFGSRIIYVYQNKDHEVFQPSSITFLVNHTLSKIRIRMFSHFWDDFGLILYDSYKHQLNYLVDDNEQNLQSIPKGEALFERMREIYFIYPHHLWNFIYYPDVEKYDFLNSQPFMFRDGEDSFPLNIKDRLDQIAQYFQKPAEIIFGD